MSQRLVKFAQLSDGRLIRVIRGAEGELEEDDSREGDGGTGGNGGGTGEGGTGEGGSTGDDGKTGSSDETEKLRVRMQAADRRASQLEAKLREYEDRDKTTEQRLTGQVETLTEENRKLREELQAARRDNAFLTTNGVTWHDAKLALSKIDWDSVTDSDSGEVNTSALKKEIERIAKESPFLVKSSGQGSGSGSGGTERRPPSGAPVGSGAGGGDKKSADRAALEKKYPALRR